MAAAGAAGAIGATATVIALASQPALALINNKGDVGKALQDLGNRAALNSTHNAGAAEVVLGK